MTLKGQTQGHYSLPEILKGANRLPLVIDFTRLVSCFYWPVEGRQSLEIEIYLRSLHLDTHLFQHCYQK